MTDSLHRASLPGDVRVADMRPALANRASAATALLMLAVAGPASSQDLSYCEALTFSSPPSDYRLRDTTDVLRWSIDDNWTAHTGPAIKRIQSGEYSRRVMADLDFTLRRWPNHVPALQALVSYDLGGGKQYGFFPTECYFYRARKLYPNDAAVPLGEGYWHWKKGDKKAAEEAYLAALSVDPNSIESHYNLGLLYADQGQYDKARQHAWAAYGSGYALPGLRNKLARAGQWRDPPPSATAGQSSEKKP